MQNMLGKEEDRGGINFKFVSFPLCAVVAFLTRGCLLLPSPVPKLCDTFDESVHTQKGRMERRNLLSYAKQPS